MHSIPIFALGPVHNAAKNSWPTCLSVLWPSMAHPMCLLHHSTPLSPGMKFPLRGMGQETLDWFLHTQNTVIRTKPVRRGKTFTGAAGPDGTWRLLSDLHPCLLDCRFSFTGKLDPAKEQYGNKGVFFYISLFSLQCLAHTALHWQDVRAEKRACTVCLRWCKPRCYLSLQVLSCLCPETTWGYKTGDTVDYRDQQTKE